MGRPGVILALCVFAAGAAPAESVRVAAAVSLKEALVEIAQAYRKEGRGEVTFSFGASGQLAAQIEYGAPIDAFVSAAHKQVDELVKAGRADGGSRRMIAANRLVLVVPAGAKEPPGGLSDLAAARVTRVAVGEPKTVPAGQYAMQALRNAGVGDALKDRIVQGATVRQVLDYVERGEVDAGIVYATDAIESGERVRVVEKIDANLHDTPEYPAVVVKGRARAGAARAFLDYLSTPTAREVLVRRGFALPTEDPSADRPGQ